MALISLRIAQADLSHCLAAMLSCRKCCAPAYTVLFSCTVLKWNTHMPQLTCWFMFINFTYFFIDYEGNGCLSYRLAFHGELLMRGNGYIFREDNCQNCFDSFLKGLILLKEASAFFFFFFFLACALEWKARSGFSLYLSSFSGLSSSETRVVGKPVYCRQRPLIRRPCIFTRTGV